MLVYIFILHSDVMINQYDLVLKFIQLQEIGQAMHYPNLRQLGTDDIAKTLVGNFGSVLVFVFYADWNQSSKKLLQSINNSIPVFGQYDNVKYYSLSAQRCPETFKKLQVAKTPAVVFTQTNMKVLYRYDGDEVGPVFDQLALVSQQHKTQFDKDKSIWHPKIKNILQSQPSIAFISGTPSHPRCPSTRTLLRILDDHHISYAHHDIAQDQPIRYWIRHHTHCPAFPCVFVNGKFIGGLAKIKQYAEKGELEKVVPQNCKESTPQQRYDKLVNLYETIVFVDGFSFENVQSETAVTNASKKYGDKIMIYNIATDKNIREYVTEKISKHLPLVMHKKEIVKVQ